MAVRDSPTDADGQAARSTDPEIDLDDIPPDTWTDEADADLQALDYSLARSGGADNAQFPCEDIANERLTPPAIVFRESAPRSIRDRL